MPRPTSLERLFLIHLWACTPFVFAWVTWPNTFGHHHDPDQIRSLRLVYAVALVYLSLRTWLTLRPRGRFPFELLWPVVDIALISLGLYANHAEPGSWAMLLYLLPLTQAAATLRQRWAMLVGALAAAAYLGVCGIADLTSTSGAFRPFFLLLMASLVAMLGREVARAQRERALAEYKDELSAEMHDGIQQYLVSIAARLELARTMMRDDPVKAAEFAVEQRHLVRQANDELRAMVRRLRSPLLEQAGLAEALRQHVELFRERAAVTAELRVTGPETRLDSRVEHALLRIVQEALTNIMKHAQADEVTVGLEFGEDRVRVSVSDDGVGFAPEAIAEQPDLGSGLGLYTMQDRAALVEGKCEVESAPGKGSTVTVTVPRRAGPAREG
jgi:signal transduction histidine kinase